MPDLVPVDYDPFGVTLEPIEHDPFGGMGPSAMAATAPAAELANNLANPVLERLAVPGMVAQGVQPETPNVMNERDAFRLNQLQQAADQFGPQQAVGMIRR